VTSPGFAATLDKVWKDADKYQPDRFKAPREEDKTPFSYIAFGGGRHGCLGQNFAYLQIKVRSRADARFQNKNAIGVHANCCVTATSVQACNGSPSDAQHPCAIALLG